MLDLKNVISPFNW